MCYKIVSPLYKVIVVLFILSITMNGQTIITPVEDVFIYTFGGGQGANIFLKYDISSVPGGVVIDSAFLTPFAHYVGGNWDGDAKFFNVNSQTWTGADSARFIYNLATSDSTHQVSGFAVAMGPTRSVDLKNIVITDYSAGHTFCSMKIKDPDDPTFNPMPGSYPVNSNETLAVGEILSSRYVYLYPSEYSNAPPWLVIYHHTVDIFEKNDASILSMHACPNPFTHSIEISCNAEDGSLSVLDIFNVTGMKIRSLKSGRINDNKSIFRWDGCNDSGMLQPNGSYFCLLRDQKKIKVLRVSLIR